MSGSAAGVLAGLSGGGFDTTGLANEMGTPIDPATFDQDGETTVNRGTSVKTGNRTESEETTFSDDGSVTQSYSSKTEVEFEVGNDDNGGSVTFSRSAGGSVTTHADGSSSTTRCSFGRERRRRGRGPWAGPRGRGIRQ
ncbi:MAG: hypothetical protein LOY01_09820 [Brachybacterium paraconglomeratum]|nr:hypothetical protein [Brachybacterium paraconglomeratum]